MKILFISSVNLTTNPRILKELKLAAELNHEVTFIGFNIGGWSDNLDKQVWKEYPSIEYIYLDATRTNFFSWLFFSLMNILSRKLTTIFKKSIYLSAAAHSKRTLQLLQKLKKLEIKSYDLIVAHTLATLYSSFIFSVKIKSKFGFDVEDYHPGEKIFNINVENEKHRRELLLKRLLPSAAYVTTAAPLITKEIEKLSGRNDIETVFNFFSKSEFVMPKTNTDHKLKLVWFSQNINAGRGLELVLSVWSKLKNNFQFTLIGKIDQEFYDHYIYHHTDIKILNPLSQQELHKSLSKYDIGLAIDVENDDYNRKLAITNKILAYFQSGLYIVATDTPAQIQFLNSHSDHGVIVKQNEESMLQIMQNIYYLKDQIRKRNLVRYERALNLSWEKESEKVLKSWDK